MKVDTQIRGDLAIVAPKGKLTIGVGDIALRNAVGEAVEAKPKTILIDLSGVTTMDSSGWGELVSAYISSQKRSVKLVLVAVPPKVEDIGQITQLITIFERYPTLQEALENLEHV